MRIEGFTKEKVLVAAYAVVIAAGMIKTGLDARHNEIVAASAAYQPKTAGKTVVIDAGHGGWDPGMLGVSGSVEADINLMIAEKVQSFLELSGTAVFITRADDSALANKKQGDLRARVQIAEEYKADIFVSIHQNGYNTPGTKGAEVFFLKDSAEGKRLAECIQGQFTSFLGQKRIAKSSGTYYVLKKSPVTSVIVECGYMSNPAEDKLLTTDEYRERVAWVIYVGIINFFNGEGFE